MKYNEWLHTQTTYKQVLLVSFLSCVLVIVLAIVLVCWYSQQFPHTATSVVTTVKSVEKANRNLNPGSAVEPALLYKIPDLSFWDFQVKLVGDMLEHTARSPRITAVHIDEPESLRYIGFGLFYDAHKVYSLGNVQHVDAISFDLNAGFTVIPASDSTGGYIINGNRIFALVAELSLPELVEMTGADVATFELLHNGYSRDKDHVYFVGGLVSVLTDADVKTFFIRSARAHQSVFGVDKKSVYYKDQLLEGIDPALMYTELDQLIVRDNDTVWFSAGNCDFRVYRKGTLDEIPTYIPPC